MGIYGNYLRETYIRNEKDILYNKNKFDSGEINLCFITGHSGSGKSTLGKKHEDEGVQWYQLDDLNCIAENFTMENLKEYGPVIYGFFNGPGKKYYLTYDELVSKNISGSEYEDKLFPEFVKYSMNYVKSHKNEKIIIEGVWLFCIDEHKKPYFKPEQFKDYAFYIKGTSMLISKYRAAKRDAKWENGSDKVNSPFQQAISFGRNFFIKNWKWYKLDEKRINVFREYFKKLEEQNNSSIKN